LVSFLFDLFENSRGVLLPQIKPLLLEIEKLIPEFSLAGFLFAGWQRKTPLFEVFQGLLPE